MGAQEKAESLGLDLSPFGPGYLALCVTTNNTIQTSGISCDAIGMLGRDLTVEQGYAAARNSAEKILRAVHEHHGTLNGLRLLKLLGCVYSDVGFTDQHKVMNGASDLFHEVFGMELGHHARSALGFSGLPTGVAVETEAIFEIL